jgi:uncharacterized protein
MNDGADPDHGNRGWNLWERLNQQQDIEQFLTKHQQEVFFDAISEHSKGYRTTDPTIAVCWDADRLDLHRKGIWPDPRMLSTQAGIDLAMNRVK